MAGVMVSGPTPWWQMPEYGGQATLDNLQKSAPDGYTYDPVQMKYVVSAASAPSQNALYGQLTGAVGGLTGAVTGAASGSGGGSTGTGSAGGGTGTASGSGSTIPYPSTSGVSTPDPTAAENAAFARAKDQAGNIARSGISSLNDEMAGRGVLNSGLTNNGLVDKLSTATNTLGDVTTAQLGDRYTAAQHTQDLANQNQNTAYTGAITQRGQDIQAQTAAAQIAMQKQSAAYQMLSSALSGLAPKLY